MLGVYGKVNIGREMQMERLIISIVAYLTTGIGVYILFLIIPICMVGLMIGSIGVLYDIFYKKLKTV